jgi:hypothetical protein
VIFRVVNVATRPQIKVFFERAMIPSVLRFIKRVQPKEYVWERSGDGDRFGLALAAFILFDPFSIKKTRL